MLSVTTRAYRQHCVLAALLCAFVRLTAAHAADAPSPPPSASAAPPPPPLHPPHLAAPVTATYPPGATEQTFVVLRVVVAPDGTVKEATVLEGREPFSAAAITALTGARFDPATRGDQPVAAVIRFRVDFEPPPPPAPVAEPAPAPAKATPARPAPPVDVTVRGYRTKSAGSEPLGRAEIRQLPGAFGDPFRAIELLPGVTPIVSGLPYYYVRGSPPSNVGYFIDGIRVPYLFHYGLGPAVIHPALVEKLELYPGGYPAQFGRYAGAIVESDLRAPSGTFHGETNIRIIDAGAFVEAPFDGGRGSAMVAGRVSYTAALISLLAQNVSLAYRDYQAVVSYHLDDKSTVSLFTFGAFDLAGDVQNGKKETLFASEFYRLDLRYDRALPEGGSVRLATAFGLDRSNLSGSRFATDALIQPRATLQMPLSGAVLLRAGLDATLDFIHGDPPAPYSEDDAQIAAETSFLQSRLDYAIGAHVDVVAKVTPALEVTPGVRADLYGSGGARAVALEPRLAARLDVTHHLRIIQAYGLAHQPPAFPVPIPALTIGNLQGGLQSSVQTSSGVEADLPEAFTATAVGFYNAFFNMNDPLGAANSSQSESEASALSSRVRGSAYGLEFSLHRSLSRAIGGYVSYTLSRSQRTIDRIRPSAFDRTHVLNVALSANLGKGWRAGARLLAYSGIPTQASTFASSSPPVPDRTPAYYRIDLRLEKRWKVGRSGYMSLVAEMLNATLNKEVLNYDCSANGCTANGIGPIAIPSLGVEGGF